MLKYLHFFRLIKFSLNIQTLFFNFLNWKPHFSYCKYDETFKWKIIFVWDSKNEKRNRAINQQGRSKGKSISGDFFFFLFALSHTLICQVPRYCSQKGSSVPPCLLWCSHVATQYFYATLRFSSWNNTVLFFTFSLSTIILDISTLSFAKNLHWLFMVYRVSTIIIDLFIFVFVFSYYSYS